MNCPMLVAFIKSVQDISVAPQTAEEVYAVAVKLEAAHYALHKAQPEIQAFLSKLLGTS